MDENQIGTIVVESSIELHRAVGPGLFESVYEELLFRLLVDRNLEVSRQVVVPINFRGLYFDKAFRADLVIENKVILELKSIEIVTPAHKKQLLTYLKLTGLKLGYLLNFGTPMMKDGISRIINGAL